MVFELVRKAVAHLEGAGDQCESVFFSHFFGHSASASYAKLLL